MSERRRRRQQEGKNKNTQNPKNPVTMGAGSQTLVVTPETLATGGPELRPQAPLRPGCLQFCPPGWVLHGHNAYTHLSVGAHWHSPGPPGRSDLSLSEHLSNIRDHTSRGRHKNTPTPLCAMYRKGEIQTGFDPRGREYPIADKSAFCRKSSEMPAAVPKGKTHDPYYRAVNNTNNNNNNNNYCCC